MVMMFIVTNKIDDILERNKEKNKNSNCSFFLYMHFILNYFKQLSWKYHCCLFVFFFVEFRTPWYLRQISFLFLLLLLLHKMAKFEMD